MIACVECEHPRPISLHRLVQSDDLTPAVEAARAERQPMLLQFGSQACARCPAFESMVAELATKYQFKWYYVDAAHPDTDLPEHFSITKLPAFVLYTHTTDEPVVQTAATPGGVRAAVAEACRPVLVLDAEF